jgi:excisionase family DNA binding protein
VRDTAPKAPPPLLVDKREAARLLGVSAGTVDNMRTRGALPSVRIGARRLYSLDDLRDYITRQRETSGGRA